MQGQTTISGPSHLFFTVQGELAIFVVFAIQMMVMCDVKVCPRTQKEGSSGVDVLIQKISFHAACVQKHTAELRLFFIQLLDMLVCWVSNLKHGDGFTCK
jgi:hypothetical protein